MGRTIAEIQSQMDAEQALQTGLSGLNSPSQVAIYTLWKYVISSCIYIHENLWDIFKSELEAIVDSAAVGTVKWVQDQVFKFQYSLIDPQIVQLVNFSPGYDPIDTTLQIVTRCSVKTLPSRVVSVKVAKNEPPTALDSSELNSLNGYLSDISFAGVQYNVISTLPDELYLDAKVYYNGQYASVIQANVISAINAYLSNIPFDGYVRASSLEDAIQSVIGVTDYLVNDLSIRSTTTPFGSGTYLIQSGTTLLYKQLTFSGYVIGETTSGQTFADKLVFIPE